jgi:hypothetical protein
MSHHLPYIPGAIWLFRSQPYVKPSLAFEATTDSDDTSAQAAFAPHKTTEQEESVDTTFMATLHVLLLPLSY